MLVLGIQDFQSFESLQGQNKLQSQSRLKMNKVQRSTSKQKANLSPTYSPSKKSKNHDQSHRKSIPKREKELPFQGKAKREKAKELSEYKKQKTRTTKTKQKQKIYKILNISPLKANKKSEKSNKVNKNESRQIQRQKRLEEYLKSKIITNQRGKQICNQSTQFFLPFTHTVQKQNSVQYISDLLSSDESCEQQDFPSDFSIVPSHQKFSYPNLKQSRIISIQQWQNYQTLKLKNEELSNYIEELEKIEKTLAKEKKQQEIQLKEEGRRDRDLLVQRYAELNERHLKVSSDNAVLHQMFNEGQSAIQALRQQNMVLAQQVGITQEAVSALKSENTKLKNDSVELKREAQELKEEIISLNAKREFMEKKYQDVRLEKQSIKTNAEAMLLMIKEMQDFQAK